MRSALRSQILQGASLAPGNISGLSFLYDPSNVANVTLNAGDVSSLTDISTNGRNATSASAQPLYNLGGINGLNSLQFTGANNDALLIQNALGMANAIGAFSFGCVFKVTSLAAANQIFYLYVNSGTNPRMFFRINVTTGKLQVNTRRLDADTTFGPVLNSVAQINTPQFGCASVNYRTGNVTIMLNGQVSVSNASTWSGFGDTSATNSGTAPTLGRIGASLFSGDLGETFGIARELSIPEMMGLRNYMRTKWGTT